MVSAEGLSDNLKRTRVLVVGDLMLDRYYWGEVRRISPEAPVPIVKVAEKSYRLGGAGNVVANLSGLGCRSALVGLIGKDTAADKIKALVGSLHVDDHTIIDDGRPTTTKTRIMAGKQQMVRLDEEDGEKLGLRISGRVLTVVKRLVDDAQAVILSDYGKGMFGSADLLQAIVQQCRQRTIPVFIDPKGHDWQRYMGATCITPNTAELERVLGHPIEEDPNLPCTLHRFCRELSLEKLLVTQGPNGMTLFQNETAPLAFAAKAREVFDVSGAGDTVIATLAACVGSGTSYADGATIANIAAGIVVGKLGTQPINWSELEWALEEEQRRRPHSTFWKVAHAAEVEARVARWRQGQQKIVFTNGCFDLLHPGHVSLLHQARSLGDRLIVGLNTDDSIKRLKGSKRPILPGKDRAAILSALEDVDMVVFFDEDTPLNLIRQVKPDILVKGSDYRIEEVVGKEIVEAYGGQVRLVEIVKGHSTTAIAQRLSANG